MLLRTKVIAAVTTAIIGTTAVVGTIAYLNEKPLNDAMTKNINATTDATKEMGKAEIVINKLISTKKSEINELNNKISDLQGQLKKSEGDNSSLESEINTLKNEKASDEQTITKLKQEIADKKVSLDEANKKAESYKDAFNSEKNEVIKANTYIQSEADKLNGQTEKLNSARETLDISVQYAINNENLGLK